LSVVSCQGVVDAIADAVSCTVVNEGSRACCWWNGSKSRSLASLVMTIQLR
jgi:hypothetical protein